MHQTPMGLPGGAEWIVILLFSALFALLPVIAFWKICSKAGFEPAISLLLLVPIANVFFMLYVAFADWPALKNRPPKE